MSYTSINPHNGEELATFPYQDWHDTSNALATANLAFTEWSQLTFSERASYIHRLAELLRKHIDRIATVITSEMGKLTAEAVAEVHKSADACDYFAIKAESLLEDEHIHCDYEQSYIHYQPLGCIVGIMPWNFPVWQVIRFMIPTLMAGNVVLIKHAENVPQCALLIAEFIELAEFPAGVFQNLLIDNATTAELIADHRCAGVSLTGSERAGRSVAATAGRHLKKTVMELGGSDPFIVLEDANLKKAAETAAISRFSNAGQTCIAAKRFIIHDAIADEFISLLKTKAEACIYGDPYNQQTTMAPLARADLRKKLVQQVELSLQLGAKAITGCQVLNSYAGYPASILDHVKKGMPAYEEELFGPVASIIRVHSDEEAIHIANNTHYGLAASIWSRNIRHAQQVADRIQAGSTFINTLVKSDVRLPFGGIKQSGFGRELAAHGIREFMNAKTVVIDTAD